MDKAKLADDLELRNTKREVRLIPAVEAREGKAAEPARVEGYAAVWNEDSQLLFDCQRGAFVERMMPNAFTTPFVDVTATYNHDDDQLVARFRASASSNSLTLTADDTGLLYSFVPGESQAARDLVDRLSRNDVDGSSFVMRCLEDEWIPRDDGLLQRNVIKAELFDVGPVMNPAYVKTTAALRSFDRWKGEQESKDRQSRLDELRTLKIKVLSLMTVPNVI